MLLSVEPGYYENTVTTTLLKMNLMTVVYKDCLATVKLPGTKLQKLQIKI